MSFYKKMNASFIYTKELKDYLRLNQPTEGKDWKQYKYNEVKSFIKRELLEIQKDKRCVYCGLRFDDRDGRQIHIEHIADKDANHAHMFTENNLVLACAGCNMAKGIKAVVQDSTGLYDKWIFDLIHPYYDKPSEHIEFQDCAAVVVNNSAKGDFTIELFKLNSDYLILERKKAKMFEKMGWTDEVFLNAIINYAFLQDLK